MTSATWSKSRSERNSPLQGSALKVVETESFSKSGANTPNFEAKVRLGQQLPMNAYSVSHTHVRAPFSKVLVRQWNGPKTSWTYAFGGQPLLYQEDDFDGASNYTVEVPSIRLADVQTAALDAYWRDASEERSDFGMMAAEGRKTAQLVTSTATRLAAVFKHLRHFDVYGAYKALDMKPDGTARRASRYAKQFSRSLSDQSRFAASSFLEMQYGWKPLLSDIHTSAERLALRNQKQNFDVTIRGVAKQVGIYKYASSGSALGWPSTQQVLPVGKNQLEIRVAYTSRYRVVSPALRIASGLGLTNPLSLAWNLLPFSFVVDWFTPIGNYFESMSALQGLAFVDAIRSTSTKVDQSIIIVGNGGISPSTLRQNEIQGSIDWENYNHSFVRVAIGAPDRPGPFRLNGSAMGSDRPLKALALLRTAALRSV
jgi:hypothetical protein